MTSDVRAAVAAPSRLLEGPPLSLRPWQRQALDAWRARGRRGVVQAVTGAGKTRVGVGAVAEALEAGRRAVVIAPSLVLVRQWMDQISWLLPGVAVTDVLGDPRPWQVLVTTVQSAMRRPAVPFGERALLVADECHRYGAEGFALALRSGFGWRLGLTATLERGDDGDEVLAAYFGGVVHDLGYREALEGSLIAPFRFAHVSVPLLPREQRTYDELTDELAVARGRLIMAHGVPEEPVAVFLRAVSDLAQDRTLNGGGGLARRYMKLFSDRRTLLAETPVKMVALGSLSPAVKRSSGTIVFTQTKEASLRAAKVLSDEGCATASVHGELDKDEREVRIDLFRKGSVIGLAAPKVLDEGVDVPEADLAVVTAANRSRRQMIQRLGRVLRRRPGKVARFVVLYAERTVEDPYFGGHIPGFFDDCLPFAEEARRFDLGRGEQGELLRFLGLDELPDGSVRDGADDEAPVVPGSAGELEPFLEVEDAAPDEALDEDGEPLERCSATVTDDIVRDYLRQIGRYPLLSAAREVELAHRIEAGLYATELLSQGTSAHRVDDLVRIAEQGSGARDEMICANLRLVVSLAKRYTGRGMDFIDLIQEGNAGLMHAVKLFDVAVGTKFSTYATWWIKQAITRGMADRATLIRVPVHMHELRHKVDRVRRDSHLSWEVFLRAHPVGLPDLHVDRETLVRIARLSQPIVSVDYLAEEFDDSVRYEALIGEADPGPEACVEVIGLRQLLDAILAPLRHEDPRAAFVLRARSGALTGDPETLDVIGKRLGVTRERVRQIEKGALSRARELAKAIGRGVEESATVADQARRPAPSTGPEPRRAAYGRRHPFRSAAPRRAMEG